MGLPKIDMPLFELEVPSTKKKVKYRPFTVKEEKILLIAQEANDIDHIITAMKQIITNCFHKIDVETLTMFDLEYLLLNIRSVSVDNKIKFAIKDKDTDKSVELELDIANIKVDVPEGHSNIISLDDGYKLLMKYPSFDQISILGKVMKVEEDDQVSVSSILFDLLISCIDSVLKEDEVYKFSDYSEEEITEFASQLPSKSMKSMQNFFETMPKVTYKDKYTNDNGDEKTVVLEGTETFFI